MPTSIAPDAKSATGLEIYNEFICIIVSNTITFMILSSSMYCNYRST